VAVVTEADPDPLVPADDGEDPIEVPDGPTDALDDAPAHTPTPEEN